MTSKLQVTLPKAIADQYRIKPGDEVLWVAAGDAIRFVPKRMAPQAARLQTRLRNFDRATERQHARQSASPATEGVERGWRREDLYDRGRSG